MQFIKPGVGGAYGAKKPWYDALNDPGYNQMKYLKNLMLTFPFFERVPDQSVIAGQNGERYDRAIATRGNDYLMVYTTPDARWKLISAKSAVPRRTHGGTQPRMVNWNIR